MRDLRRGRRGHGMPCPYWRNKGRVCGWRVAKDRCGRLGRLLEPPLVFCGAIRGGGRGRGVGEFLGGGRVVGGGGEGRSGRRLGRDLRWWWGRGVGCRCRRGRRRNIRGTWE